MNRRWFVALVPLFAATPLLASFAERDFPALHFNREPPFRFAVDQIEIVNRDPSPGQPPRVDQKFPLTPARALEHWAVDRLKAAGGPNRLIFAILRARATDTPLRVESGSLSSVGTDQLSDRYDLALDAQIDIVDPRGHAVASARAYVTRYQTVLQSTRPDQLDEIWYDMVRAAMTQLAPTLDREIRAHLAMYLR